jgi:hypothetical protein
MRFLMLAAAIFVLAPAAGRAAETYRVDRWPADIDTIPCSAWVHYPDGTWALNGYVRIGGAVAGDIGFKGDGSARLLDRKCGKK